MRRRAKGDTIYRIEESDDDLEDSDEGSVWEQTEVSDLGLDSGFDSEQET